jgi:hypothetical protein
MDHSTILPLVEIPSGQRRKFVGVRPPKRLCGSGGVVVETDAPAWAS